MQYYQCKCGETKAWTTMGVERCARCKKCGSDLAQGPNSHKEQPEPHKWITTKVETDEGSASLTRCEYCHKTKTLIELEEATEKL